MITGDAGFISNLCKLGWFDWCYYRDANSFPKQEERLGRSLGPAANYLKEMSHWISKDIMKITARHTFRPLTDSEYRDLNIARK